MISRDFEQNFRQKVNDSQLSASQKSGCNYAMYQLDGYEYAITPNIVEGDFQLDINISPDNKKHNLRNETDWIAGILRKSNVQGITVRVNDAESYSTITVRTLEPGDNGDLVDQSKPTNEVPTPPINGNVTIDDQPKPPVEVQPIAYADSPSYNSRTRVDANSPNTSEFYVNAEVYLEGVQVPHSSVSISYGLNSPPTATVIIPASRIIRDLPETTKVHVFFEDLLPDENGIYQWRLLFDGEMSGFSYTVDSNGANMSINAIHSSAYLTLMQLMTLDASEYLFNPNQRVIGDATIPMLFGQNKINSKIIQNIIKGKNFESMADIVYQLIRGVLDGTQDSPVGRYYHDKLSTDPKGWKVLQRIFGVSKKAASSPVPTYETQYNADGKLKSTKSSGTSSDGSAGAPKLADADTSRNYSKSDFVRARDSDASSEYKGMDERLLSMLDTMTERLAAANPGFGRFEVTSGFRSISYNAQEGGAEDSYHTKGMAVDLVVPTRYISGYDLYNMAKSIGFGGVHFYEDRGFIHVDTGPDRTWSA